jgi:hypothetical protein
MENTRNKTPTQKIEKKKCTRHRDGGIPHEGRRRRTRRKGKELVHAVP